MCISAFQMYRYVIAVGIDRSEDLFLDISYDGVSNYDSIKLVDGDGNENIDWGSPDGDESVSSHPYTFCSMEIIK
jgi:hypothetical protein